MVKSFFDPNWVDLGLLGSYGRWAGVNWVWSVELTIYHAVFSIAIPVLLVNLMFPSHRSQSWVSRRKFNLLCVLVAADVVFAFFFITPYRPPVVPYLLALVTVICLILLARRLPQIVIPEKRGTISPLRSGFAAFLATVAFFLISWILPNTGLHPLLTMLVMAALIAAVGWVILKSGISSSGKHQLALASGALGFFILLAPIQEMDKTRPDNTAGMTLVGIAMAVFLIWMARRLPLRQ